MTISPLLNIRVFHPYFAQPKTWQNALDHISNFKRATYIWKMLGEILDHYSYVLRNERKWQYSFLFFFFSSSGHYFGWKRDLFGCRQHHQHYLCGQAHPSSTLKCSMGTSREGKTWLFTFMSSLAQLLKSFCGFLKKIFWNSIFTRLKMLFSILRCRPNISIINTYNSN